MHCWFVQLFDEEVKRLIYLGYWRMKHWKYLVFEKDAKADINLVGVCKAGEVRRYFVNSKIESKVFSWCVNYVTCSLDFKNISYALFLLHTLQERCIVSFRGTYWFSSTFFILLRVFRFFILKILKIKQWSCSQVSKWTFERWVATALFNNQHNWPGSVWAKFELHLTLVS